MLMSMSYRLQPDIIPIIDVEVAELASATVPVELAGVCAIMAIIRSYVLLFCSKTETGPQVEHILY